MLCRQDRRDGVGEEMSRKLVIQEHHIRYGDGRDTELIVRVTKGQHRVLTWLGREKNNISVGLVIALETWLAQNRHKAREL